MPAALLTNAASEFGIIGKITMPNASMMLCNHSVHAVLQRASSSRLAIRKLETSWAFSAHLMQHVNDNDQATMYMTVRHPLMAHLTAFKAHSDEWLEEQSPGSDEQHALEGLP